MSSPDPAIIVDRDKHYWTGELPLRFNSRDDTLGVTEGAPLVPTSAASGGSSTMRIATAGKGYQ